MRSFSRFAPFGLILVVCLAPMFARAADVTIMCQESSTYTTGEPIPANAVPSFRIYSGSNVLDTQPACKFVRTNLAANVYNYTVTQTETVDGEVSAESDSSSPVQVTVPGAPPVQLLTLGPYSYEATGAANAPTMSAIGLVTSGLPCGPTVRLIGTVRFCQITRSQTDLIGWPSDKTLAAGLWAKVAP